MSDPSGAIFVQQDGTVLILASTGPSGAPAFVDGGFSFSFFGPNAILYGCGFAHYVEASQATSVAVTGTPPTVMPQTIELFKNGVAIGNATWQVGQTLGNLTLSGGNVTFGPPGDLPSFGTPGTLDPSFKHFAITYAGP